jgi:hypothetical protein
MGPGCICRAVPGALGEPRLYAFPPITNRLT